MFQILRRNIKLSSNNKLLITLVLSVFLLITFVKSEETSKQDNPDKIFDEVNSIKLKDMKGLDVLLEESDMTYFAYYYKKTSPNSRIGASFLKKISDKLLYLAQIVMIDCDEITTDSFMCKKDPEVADGFPKMEVYSPPEYKVNPYTKERNTHTKKMYDSAQVSENSLYNFITRNIPARSTKITTENFENFVTNMEFNKVLLFTDKTRTPLLFRGISNFFYDRLLFGEVQKDQLALLKKFKVEIFPTLLVYQTHEDGMQLDEPQIEVYKGDIKAEDIVNFIGEFSLKEPLSRKIQNTSDINELKYKTTFKNLDKSTIGHYVKKFNEKRFVIYANDKDDIPEDIKKFNMHTHGFFHFINFECKKNIEAENFCKEHFKVTEFPSLILYKNVEKNFNGTYQKGGIFLPLELSGIEREIYRIYQGNLKEGNTQTFSSLTNESKIKKKIPFLYLHEGEIPLGLYLISSEEKYLKYVDFIVFEHPPKELVDQIKLKKLPQMIVLLQEEDKQDSARILHYNEELVYSRLSNFINQYFNTERDTKIVEDVEEKQDIPFIGSNDDLNNNCLKGKKLCIFGLLNGKSNKDAQKQFQNSIKVLENVESASRKKSLPTTFGWVNATCHEELLNTLNINLESLPNLLVYVPAKNLYTSLIGTFDEDTINLFLNKVVNGKVSMQNLDKSNMVFEEKRCEDIKEEISEVDEDDELMKEIIEEEKKKREQFEKEREQLDGEGKKKKKKKKKKDDL